MCPPLACITSEILLSHWSIALFQRPECFHAFVQSDADRYLKLGQPAP